LAASAPLLPPRRPFVVTILREPVKRYLSEFRHVCQSGMGQWDYATLGWRLAEAKRLNFSVPTKKAPRSNKVLPPLKEGKTTTDDEKNIPAFHVDCLSPEAVLSFLEHPDHVNGARNRQTRMLSGAVMTGSLVDERPERVLFEIAVANLRSKIDVAIVFESFQLSLLVLAKKLGLPPPPQFSVLKEAKEDTPRPHVNDATVKRIAELNHFDVLLHDEATQRLRAEARELLGELHQTFASHVEKTGTEEHHDDNETGRRRRRRHRRGKLRRLDAEVPPLYECAVVTAKNRSVVFPGDEQKLHYYEARRCSLEPKLRDLNNEKVRASSSAHNACVTRANAKRHTNAISQRARTNAIARRGPSSMQRPSTPRPLVAHGLPLTTTRQAVSPAMKSPASPRTRPPSTTNARGPEH